jgi:hypothetical protein
MHLEVSWKNDHLYSVCKPPLFISSMFNSLFIIHRWLLSLLCYYSCMVIQSCCWRRAFEGPLFGSLFLPVHKLELCFACLRWFPAVSMHSCPSVSSSAVSLKCTLISKNLEMVAIL